MLAETLASLGRVPTARDNLLLALAPDVRAAVAQMQARVRVALGPGDAYHSIHDRGPRPG